MTTSDEQVALSSELERLFDLDELRSIARDLLGIDPDDVGSGSSGAFARSLTKRCAESHRLAALCDAINASSDDVDAAVLAGIARAASADDELPPGGELGPYLILRRLGSGNRGTVYLAKRGEHTVRLKVLRESATADPIGLERFLTVSRVAATLGHPGLPRGVEAGQHLGRYYVASTYVDGQTLAQRIARAGALHLEDARQLMRGMLEPLAALHSRRVPHGDLRAENILLDEDRVVLLDVGSHFLSGRSAPVNGKSDMLGALGSDKTLAPEQIDGRVPDARSDLYAFGALIYEILTGHPVFEGRSAAERLLGHLTREPQPPSLLAPPGWVTPDLDDFVTGLLSKDPGRRPASTETVLASLDSLGSSTSLEGVISDEELEQHVDALLSDPTDDFAEEALVLALRRGGDVQRIAETFRQASDLVDMGYPSGRATQHRLISRAARLYETSLKDLETAEALYARLVDEDPENAEALAQLDRVRRQLGKHDDIVENYLARVESAQTPEEKAELLTRIGELYESELDDSEQALIAYTQAFCEDPRDQELAKKIGRIAGKSHEAWNEVMSSCLDASVSEMPADKKIPLLQQMGDWYLDNIARADLALPCFHAVLGIDPADGAAMDGVIRVLRKAGQWQELGHALLTRAAAPTTSPMISRELKAEAGEILGHKLGRPAEAREIFEEVIAADPTHDAASESLARIYEESGQFDQLVRMLERRADAQSGEDQLDTLHRIGEVYEVNLGDIPGAIKRYRAVVARDPRHIDALHGLDRCLSREGDFDDLIDNLQMQIEAAATPRQKVHLYERIAAVWDEEFLNHDRAAEAWENVLDLDAGHQEALANLVRHYRALERWKDVAVALERHAMLLSDEPNRQIEKLIALGRVLSENLDARDRAIAIFEQVLSMDPQNAEALEAVAGLRVELGETAEALAALEQLARDATTPSAKAEQYIRAARLLEARGDKDGAIERYKLAVDANPSDRATSTILRAAYVDRGDVSAAAELLEREIDRTEGESARAKLSGELAALYLDRVDNEVRAESWAKVALDADPTNLEALRVMGDLAHRAGRHREAVRYYDQVANRTDAMTQPEAVRVLKAFSESLIAIDQGKRAASQCEKLVTTAPDDLGVLAYAAGVLFDHGQAQRSFELHWDYLHRTRETLPKSMLAKVLYRMGESARRAGDLSAATGPLEESAALEPTENEPLVALAQVHAARENWEAALETMYRQLDNVTGDDRVTLLLEIGDLASKKLKEPDYAAKSYLAALNEQPNDRRILTKLMQLYSEKKDWDRLIRVILKLADFVDDNRQKSKYMHTAGRIAFREMNDAMRGSQLMAKALELDPDNHDLIDEALDVHNKAQNAEALKELLKRRIKVASDKNDRGMLLGSLTTLANLYLTHFKRLEQAIAVLEGAQEVEDSVDRREQLAELYVSDAPRYFERAVRSHVEILERDPFRAEAHRRLRQIYTENKQPDPAWCCCQALYVLGQAEADEERFFLRMRSDDGAAARDRLRDADFYSLLMHPEAHPQLTALFTIIEPAALAVRSKPLPQLGYKQEHLVDPSRHEFAAAQTIPYVADVLGQACPPMLQNPNDLGELGFIPSQPPAILLGTSIVGVALPPQTALFMAARHLTFYRRGLYIRQLVPTIGGLKAWLFAAIAMAQPGFPVPRDITSAVQEAHKAIDRHVAAPAREQLASVVKKLIGGGASLDLKKWVRGIDLSADRAGLLMCDDLQTAVELIRTADPRAAMATAEERVEHVFRFAVSEAYFEARRKLQISIDS